jgi:ABC-type transport system involved in cytochrome bd biosynthesis fused ATPase/permease subunit
MDFWGLLISIFAIPLDQSGQMLAHMPVVVAGILIAVPVIATFLSMRLTFICGVTVLLVVAVTVLMVPAAAPGITAIAAYLASLLLAYQAVQDWRGSRAESAELTELRAIITKMQDAEARRFLTELTSNKATNVMEARVSSDELR